MELNKLSLIPKDGYEEIVAVLIDNIIYSGNIGISKLKEVIEERKSFELIGRKRLNLMSNFDLGKKWDLLANGVTLFYAHENLLYNIYMGNTVGE